MHLKNKLKPLWTVSSQKFGRSLGRVRAGARRLVAAGRAPAAATFAGERCSAPEQRQPLGRFCHFCKALPLRRARQRAWRLRGAPSQALCSGVVRGLSSSASQQAEAPRDRPCPGARLLARRFHSEPWLYFPRASALFSTPARSSSARDFEH